MVILHVCFTGMEDSTLVCNQDSRYLVWYSCNIWAVWWLFLIFGAEGNDNEDILMTICPVVLVELSFNYILIFAVNMGKNGTMMAGF